jgi:hypothetical protein
MTRLALKLRLKHKPKPMLLLKPRVTQDLVLRPIQTLVHKLTQDLEHRLTQTLDRKHMLGSVLKLTDKPAATAVFATEALHVLPTQMLELEQPLTAQVLG